MKNKSKHYISIDLDNRYMSTYHFVGYNELSNVANMLWGKGWIASDDITQIQELLDHVEKDMYTVHHVKGLRDDYDIEIRLNGAWRLQKQINWFNDFVDYVQQNSINIYNEACVHADYMEETIEERVQQILKQY